MLKLIVPRPASHRLLKALPWDLQNQTPEKKNIHILSQTTVVVLLIVVVFVAAVIVVSCPTLFCFSSLECCMKENLIKFHFILRLDTVAHKRAVNSLKRSGKICRFSQMSEDEV